MTVTWMKLCGEIMRLTGDPKVFDEIERSAYNALLGSMRPDGCYFDYFQRFNGQRDNQINFGWDFNGVLLTCCSANGPAGVCRMPFFSFLRDGENGLVINSPASGSSGRTTLPSVSRAAIRWTETSASRSSVRPSRRSRCPCVSRSGRKSRPPLPPEKRSKRSRAVI